MTKTLNILPRDAAILGLFMIDSVRCLPRPGDYVDFYNRKGNKVYGRVRSMTSTHITINVKCRLHPVHAPTVETTKMEIVLDGRFAK